MYEIEFKNYDLDMGRDETYCERGLLVLQVDTITEDSRFDAYNLAGRIQCYGSQYEIVGVRVLQATFYSETYNDETDVTHLFQDDTDWIVDHIPQEAY